MGDRGMPDRETIDEMIEYFSRCFMNVHAGGAAQKQFERYIDTLTLLREQEPVKTEPVRFRVVRAGGSNYPFLDCVCDGCGFKTSVAHTNWRFCPECGRAVKWDD